MGRSPGGITPLFLPGESHRLQQTRFPCPSPIPGAYSNSCPWSQRCRSPISSSVIPFSFCLQSFPASGSFPMNPSHQVAKVLELSISPSSHECSGLSAFRSDWFDNLAVQKTLKSLLQHQGSKPSVLQHSAFFMVQLSHPYTTTGKTIALTRRTLWAK